MDGRRIDLNSADLTTLLRETELDVRKAEVLVNARPFWDDSELRMLPGFGNKTLRELAMVACVFPPHPLDINTCSQEELQGIPGVGKVLARRIVSGRPYSSLDKLMLVGGINREVMLTLRQRTDVADRRPVERVTSVLSDEDILDLNSCDERALQRLPRIGAVLARRIALARPFRDVDALIEIKGVSPAMLPSLRSRLVVRSQSSDERPDVNSCEPRALQRLHGVGPSLAMRVISGRPYVNWDEMLDLEGVGPVLLERLRRECQLHLANPEEVEAEFVEDERWFTEEVFEDPLIESRPSLPQVSDQVMSLVAYEAAVDQEIRRRIPLFVSGWVVAAVLITGILVLFFSGSIQFQGWLP